MRDDAAISPGAALNPAGKSSPALSVSKDPFVTPTAPRNLWLYLRAILKQPPMRRGASMAHENGRFS
jgi:hypothetical protein